MLILTCPHCGIAAAEIELAAGGEAHVARLGPGSGDGDFADYLFGRRNPRGVHFERWRHAYGCGKWFAAARNTVTHEVYGTYIPAAGGAPAGVLARIRQRHPDWQPDPVLAWPDPAAASAPEITAVPVPGDPVQGAEAPKAAKARAAKPRNATAGTAAGPDHPGPAQTAARPKAPRKPRKPKEPGQ